MSHVPNYEALRKRRWRARRLRADDPAAFYALRHRRKQERRMARITVIEALDDSDDLTPLMLGADDLVELCTFQ